MFLRASLALLVLPGIFAGLIPAWIAHSDRVHFGSWRFGFALVTVGLALLLWCVRDFWVLGKGTLAPWDPPKRLVIVGLYRFVRNPMYVAIVILLSGWVLASGSLWLAIYQVVLMIGFHLRVILYEEPRLRRQFAEEWKEYSGRVHRWWPVPKAR